MFSIEDEDTKQALVSIIFLDVSGSIDLKMIRNRLESIHGSLSAALKCDPSYDFILHIVPFEMRTHTPRIITPKNVDEILHIMPFIRQGGGTDINCCWDYVKHNPSVYDVMIITDGYLSYGTNPGISNLIFILIGGQHSYAPPYGKYIII